MSRSLVLGRYEVREEIGHGADAQVFAGWDTELDRPVAVKRLTAGTAEKADAFDREAQMLLALDDPRVVKAYAYDDDPYAPAIVMEHVPGRTLADRIHRPDPAKGEQGRLGAAEGVKVLTDLAGALKAVHGAGIVHRDIKPANVLLPDDGSAILCDFGIALYQAEGEPRSDRFPGTPGYTAPERIDGSSPGTPRSDLYSLGVLAYEMFTGRPPFAGETVEEILHAQLHGKTVMLKDAAPDLPLGLSLSVQELLIRRPEGRLRSARALESQLKPLAAAPPQSTAAAGLSVRRLTQATARQPLRPGQAPSVSPAAGRDGPVRPRERGRDPQGPAGGRQPG